jgi:hypothetical protein
MDTDTRPVTPQDAARVSGMPVLEREPPAAPAAPPPTFPSPTYSLYSVPASSTFTPPAPAPPPNRDGTLPTPEPPVGAPPAGPAATTNVIALALIGLGALLFVGQFSDILGQASLLLVGLVLLYFYFQAGRGAGFLISGAIISGLGAGAFVEAMGAGNGYAAIGLGLGFCAIWAVERERWWALIPGALITLAGLQDVIGGSVLRVWWQDWGLERVSIWPLILMAVGVWLIFARNNRPAPR